LIGSDSVLISSAVPRQKKSPASVMRNAGRLKNRISAPWAVPKSVPSPRAIAIARSGCSAGSVPVPFTSVAIRMLVQAMTAPTDKSIPPERMTNVTPTAATPRNALSETKFRKTRAEKKPSKERHATA
jgi:hypothetical protein